jgi:hypothetical protein
MELNEHRLRRRAGRIAGLVAGTVLLMGAGATPKPCCFTNPRYSGVCAVQPGEGETCQSILDYLNNPQSQGKNYCGNTNVRGGWAQAICEK